MSEKLLNKNLRPGETLSASYREHLIVYWWHMCLSILLIVIPFFFLYPLFSYRFWGIMAFILLIAAGLFIGIRAWYLYNNNVFIITDKRILGISQQGIFHKGLKEAGFDNIAEISYNKNGLVATIFNYGDVKIQTNIEGISYCIRRVKRPDQVRDELQNQLKLCRNQNG